MPPATPGPAAAASARANRLGLIVLLGTLTAFGPLGIDMFLPALPMAGVVAASACTGGLALALLTRPAVR